MKEAKIFFMIIYFIIGVYFINSAIVFYEIPEISDNIGRWITLVGGLLIIYGSINFMRIHKPRMPAF
jgi:cytochrome c biogenesis protein CcdA